MYTQHASNHTYFDGIQDLNKSPHLSLALLQLNVRPSITMLEYGSQTRKQDSSLPIFQHTNLFDKFLDFKQLGSLQLPLDALLAISLHDEPSGSF